MSDISPRKVIISNTSNSGTVGALAANNLGSIDNVIVTGRVTGGFGEKVGGLVGANLTGGTILNSEVLGSVTSGYKSNTGGLVGKHFGSIVNSYAEGHVVGGYSSSVGGLVGFDEGMIDSSHATDCR